MAACPDFSGMPSLVLICDDLLATFLIKDGIARSLLKVDFSLTAMPA
jgi:hypothetical protein